MFVERRGRGTLGEIQFGPAYFQDDIPIRDATVFRGHAVRALYLAAGAVDVAVETGDDELLGTLIAQWENTIARRTYLTGGMGSQHTGEAFGDDFVLPPDRAYSETCAGIASVMLAWRLLLATGEARFADLIERTLHNVDRHLTGAGRPPLLLRQPAAPAGAGDRASPRTGRASGRLRACASRGSSSPAARPTSPARSPASPRTSPPPTTAGSNSTSTRSSRVRTTLDDGRAVGLERLDRAIPHDGTVTVRITETDGRPWAYAADPAVGVGAELVDPDGRRDRSTPGTVVVERPFAVGDEVTLTLPMAPRWTRPDPRIDAVRGCVAVERGPLVMCAESVDLPGERHVDVLRVDPSVPPRDGDDAEVVVAAELIDPPERTWPYGDDAATEPAATHAGSCR